MAKNTPDLTTMLKPRDRQILDQGNGISWVPKNPRELILPYIDSTEEKPEKNSIEDRRQKAKNVYDGYGKIIEECKGLEEEISKQCKDATITLNPSKHLRIMEAIKRVFGTDGTTITFAMYKACVDALASTSNSNIPTI